MTALTHLSLFSGIGGLDMAAEWAGMETIGQCEWAEYPARSAGKALAGHTEVKDIRTLTKESFYERTGRRTVDVISGDSMSAFFRAGKQRGKEDDRYLWPEWLGLSKNCGPLGSLERMLLESCAWHSRHTI